MAKQIINAGTAANDGTGDTLRAAAQKINSNFTEVYGNAQDAFNRANTVNDRVSNLETEIEMVWSTANAAFDAANIGGGLSGNIIVNSTNSAINFVSNSSGDGYGFSTVEIRPDTGNNPLYYDQYLIIDPTYPSHIHIRAGGTQDASNSSLFLGGEISHVRVESGTNPPIVIRSNDSDWQFKSNSVLELPTGGTLGPEGMGWTGLSSGISETPVSVVYKTNTGTWQAALSLFGGNDIDGEGSVALYTYDANTTNSYQWSFNSNGEMQLPINGDIKNSDGNSVIKSIPQNRQSSAANYTLVASDAGKHIYKNDNDYYAVIIPTDAEVNFQIGTAITVVSGNSWTYISTSNSAQTQLWGAGYNQTSNNFYIPNNSMATLLKVDSDKWILSGAGLAID